VKNVRWVTLALVIINGALAVAQVELLFRNDALLTANRNLAATYVQLIMNFSRDRCAPTPPLQRSL